MFGEIAISILFRQRLQVQSNKYKNVLLKDDCND